MAKKFFLICTDCDDNRYIADGDSIEECYQEFLDQYGDWEYQNPQYFEANPIKVKSKMTFQKE